MVQVNPKLLEQPRVEVKPRVSPMMPSPQRGGVLSIVALVKRAVTDAFKDTVLRVKVEDEKVIDRIISKLDTLNSTIKSLPKIDMGDAPASINIQTMSENTIAKMTGQLDEIRKAVVASRTAPQPTIQQVKVTNPTPQASFPVSVIVKGLENVQKEISKIKLEVPQAQVIDFPEMPKIMSMTEGKAILKALENMSKKLDDLPKEFPDVHIPTSVEISNFPPQKYPMPVTNININPLRGFAKTTAVTVTTALTPLPGEVLAYRRSLVVYNNSSSVTIYLGGSTMTFSDGIPVPPNSYSPAFDAGPRMIVYARTSASTANVRVLELSNENIGG